jgi:hypothetical protein
MDPHAVVTPPYVAGPFRLEPFAAMRLRPNRVGDPSTGRAFARPYKTVAARLVRWQERGRLVQDSEPSLYLHEYTANDITIRGTVGALEISQRALIPEDRVVLPHEGIHPVQADELADRMAEMCVNPAPILLVHQATEGARSILGDIAGSEPDHAFTDRSQQQHRIWQITDRDAIETLNQEYASTRALIADGHHRYAAYLRLQRRHPGTGFDQGLAMLVDQGTTPLFLGPVHRSFAGTGLDDVRNAAEALHLEYQETDRATALAALDGSHAVVTDGERWGTLAFEVPPDTALVELLHDRFVPALPYGPRTVDHHHTVEHAIRASRPGTSVAVLMPAPSVELVERVAAADRLLPEKATSFQPKPSLGVLIRPVEPKLPEK